MVWGLMVDEDRFAAMLTEVRPHLNEMQWRLLLWSAGPVAGPGRDQAGGGAGRGSPGHGGPGSPGAGAGHGAGGQDRRAGAGRPRAGEVDAGLVPALGRL